MLIYVAQYTLIFNFIIKSYLISYKQVLKPMKNYERLNEIFTPIG